MRCVGLHGGCDVEGGLTVVHEYRAEFSFAGYSTAGTVDVEVYFVVSIGFDDGCGSSTVVWVSSSYLAYNGFQVLLILVLLWL